MLTNYVSSNVVGSLQQVPGGSGAVRIGTSTFVSSTLEQVSNLYTVTVNTQASSLSSRLYLNTNTALSVAMASMRGEVYRQITADTTDTNVLVGLNAQVFVNVASTKTYTNTGANGVSALRISAISLDSSLGALAITTYHGIYVLADSTTNTGLKTALRLGAPTNGSVGNAFIADNTSYTGSYFINSSSTSASSFAGQVRVASLGVGNSAAATVAVGALAAKIQVYDGSGVSLGFLPVYASIT